MTIIKTLKIQIWIMSSISIRDARPEDMDDIAMLHANSWMIAYRGLLSDQYLDNDLQGERKKYWAQKLPTIRGKEFVLVAERDQEIIGFVAVLDKPEAGYDALVDNLHVRPDLKGQGIGGLLLKAMAKRLIETGRRSYYLTVLVGNTSAEKFYLAKGGVPRDISTREFGGKKVQITRFVWERLVD
jgi:ribosomal protein S18 acetylase RimI-like enzyme